MFRRTFIFKLYLNSQAHQITNYSRVLMKSWLCSDAEDFYIAFNVKSCSVLKVPSNNNVTAFKPFSF